MFFTNSCIHWEWIIPDRQTVYHSDQFCPFFFYNSCLQNRIKKCLSKSVWRQNQTNDFGLCEPCNEHMFASWVWLSVSFLLCLSTLQITQHYWLPKWACHRLSKWHTARVSLFWFASLWRWFQDGNLMTLRVKQLLKARRLHCCRWANQTGANAAQWAQCGSNILCGEWGSLKCLLMRVCLIVGVVWTKR